ncbi:hypothetical protein J6590_066560 [Homalodisca vitripennis]|nr:hypothetical protein J6590_066560 [Homalodisca vitripennis]
MAVIGWKEAVGGLILSPAVLATVFNLNKNSHARIINPIVRDEYENNEVLGTDMMIWMSTGLPFNATFDYMRRSENEEEYEVPMARQLSAVEPRKDNDTSDGCILLRSPDMYWDKDDCTKIRDFICEQTRCYYYNYGSIPVSPAQG